MILSIIVALFRVFTHVVVVAMDLPLLGAIGKLDPSTKTFTVHSERLDQFFVANNNGSYPESTSEAVIAAEEKKKVAVMVSVIGKKTYSVLRDLCSPVNPKRESEHSSIYLSYYSSKLNPSDWKLQNPIDSIVAFKEKM